MQKVQSKFSQVRRDAVNAVRIRIQISMCVRTAERILASRAMTATARGTQDVCIAGHRFTHLTAVSAEKKSP